MQRHDKQSGRWADAFRKAGMRHWNITAKIIFVALCAMIPTLLLISLYVLPAVKEDIYASRIRELRHVIDIAGSLMAAAQAKVDRGEISRDDARQQVLAQVKVMRYDEKNYIWINDMDGVMVMHPTRPDMVGKNVLGESDPSGKRFFQEMVDSCRARGEGVVLYSFLKPGTGKALPKASFVRNFAPWGWIAGSGAYLDDIETEWAEFRVKVFVALGIALAVSIGVALMIGRVVRRPLSRLVQTMNHARLDTRFESTDRDEIGEVTRAFDRFVSSVSATISMLNDASDRLKQAVQTISAATEELAAGSAEQTSKVDDVAGAVDGMTRTILESARSAGSTAETARDARATAEAGGKVVDETIVGMREIAATVKHSSATIRDLGRSSDQIGEIIGVIDDIADQTNLLALNAAIEAARAGDQGRGFAVVADEVRKLAERTTKATKEITGMIQAIQLSTREAVASMEEGTEKVDRGIALADRAGNSLKEIVGVSGRVMEMVTTIAESSTRQSTVSQQVSRDAEAISRITNESAKGTQQIAEVAEDLNRLTRSIHETLLCFSQGNTTGAKTPASAVHEEQLIEEAA
jgi:methyl-accepting chemotaxis protein